MTRKVANGQGTERRRVGRVLGGAFVLLAVLGAIAAFVVTSATAAEPITLDIIAAGPLDAQTFKCPGVQTDVIDPADCTVRVPTSRERFPDADAVFPVNLHDATDETVANFFGAGPHAGLVLCGNYDNPGPSYLSVESLGTAPHGEQIDMSTTPAEEAPTLGYAISGQFDIGRGEGCHINWGVYHFSFYGPPGIAAIEGAEAGQLDWSVGMFRTFDPARGAITSHNTLDYANIVATFDETVPVTYEEWTLADWVERWAIPQTDPPREMSLTRIWGTYASILAAVAAVGLVVAVPVFGLARRSEISAAKNAKASDTLNHELSSSINAATGGLRGLRRELDKENVDPEKIAALVERMESGLVEADGRRKEMIKGLDLTEVGEQDVDV